jgi:Concanavalin A-like lectin/glucanases superfamily
MRAALFPSLALPLLLSCGAKGDLIIGMLEPVVAGSPSVIPNAGAGATPTTAGSDQGGVAGVAGTASESGGTAGDAPVENGGAPAESTCIGDEEPPQGSLIHRYSFDGTGATVVDSVGGADGTLINGVMLDGSGVLTLPGEHITPPGPDEYANLPNGLISSLSEVTIIAWTTWVNGAGYQRVFDFGISDTGEGQGNSGKSYVAVMPSTGFANGTGLGAEIAAPGFPTLSLGSPEMMNNRPAMVALSLQSGLNVALFLDGKLLIQSPTPLKLSDIKDVNDFVGESQWSKDHAYHGSYTEFRIYNAALSACQLHTLLVRGPDAP